jgi:hypothetical protein
MVKLIKRFIISGHLSEGEVEQNKKMMLCTLKTNHVIHNWVHGKPLLGCIISPWENLRESPMQYIHASGSQSTVVSHNLGPQCSLTVSQVFQTWMKEEMTGRV